MLRGWREQTGYIVGESYNHVEADRATTLCRRGEIASLPLSNQILNDFLFKLNKGPFPAPSLPPTRCKRVALCWGGFHLYRYEEPD
jgi:hypothetical protein